MHPTKLMNEIEFVDYNYPGIITPQVKELMKNVHPTQFLNSQINMVLYKVNYSYITKRNNLKESDKYIFIKETHEDIEFEIQCELENWSEKFNKEFPFKAISNVKILGISPIANANLKLQ